MLRDEIEVVLVEKKINSEILLIDSVSDIKRRIVRFGLYVPVC